ncbi:MAG: GGDEF domain-containing protein [Chloroflexi bacterium]|nr:MAG: GGDEF domain-containing protein [Chloroflexota bacterium]
MAVGSRREARSAGRPRPGRRRRVNGRIRSRSGHRARAVACCADRRAPGSAGTHGLRAQPHTRCPAADRNGHRRCHRAVAAARRAVAPLRGEDYSHRAAEARASTDALTGLPNRRYFDEFCGLMARRRRADDAVGVLMIDIDHFKRLNDTRGHGTGDQVLKAVAGAIASTIREDDVPARYGGEEFAVLLRNPSPLVAFEVGERVRAAVESLDVSHLDAGPVSVSVGVALAGSADQPIEEIVAQADRALYAAKRGGRNRVAAAA